MADLLGFTSILIVALFTLIISFYNPSIQKILFVALVIRIFFLLLGHYLISLPDSTADAETYERMAWMISQGGFFSVLYDFEISNNQFISWLIAIPYSLFGRSLLMAKSISLFFGICNVYLGWKVAKRIWDSNTAKKAAWIIALFPSLILYSVLVMREVYVCFFLLIALYGVFSWFQNYNLKYFLISILGFIGATFFHGAMILGAFVFSGIAGIISFRYILKSLSNLKINPKYLIFFLIFVIPSWLFFANKIELPKLTNFGSIHTDTLLRRIDVSNRGEASYPEWTKSNSLVELIYKMPVRITYFLFAPFPWDITKSQHLIGMFDAFLYMYLIFLVILNRKVIWKNPSLKIFLLILLFYLIIFSFGVGNFGTSVRHRSKFVIILILLAAPLIKKFILFRK
jgi:4-amino-4-deoxy-L-arabinose transferase-like glycosyltransferase